MPGHEGMRSGALALRAADRPQIWDDLGLQHLWLAMQQRPWRSLALVSSGKNIETIDLADRFAKLAWWYGGQATCVFDLRDLGMRLVAHQVRDIARQVERGNRVFIALRSVAENPTTIPVAQSADAAILCVTLGKTEGAAAERGLMAIGRERFLGTILVNDSNANASPRGERSHHAPLRA